MLTSLFGTEILQNMYLISFSPAVFAQTHTFAVSFYLPYSPHQSNTVCFAKPGENVPKKANVLKKYLLHILFFL